MSNIPKHNRQNTKRDHLKFLKYEKIYRGQFYPAPRKGQKLKNRLKRVTRGLHWEPLFYPQPNLHFIHCYTLFNNKTK